nr:hypothetical protein OG513_07575 [Streptomyces sp. NBC_00998]
MSDTTPVPVVDPLAALLAKADLPEDVLYDAWNDLRHTDEDRASAVYELYALARDYRVAVQKRSF